MFSKQNAGFHFSRNVSKPNYLKKKVNGHGAIVSSSPADSFVFTKPNKWLEWIRRFERLRLASGLDDKPDAMQVNALVYAMGDEASDIMAGYDLTEEKNEVYQTVKTKFDEHLVVRRNTIFEPAKCNRRCQEEGENVDSYTEVYLSTSPLVRSLVKIAAD